MEHLSKVDEVSLVQKVKNVPGRVEKFPGHVKKSAGQVKKSAGQHLIYSKTYSLQCFHARICA